VSTVWEFILLGIGLSPAYILAAQGTVLVYKGSRVVNFAQGGFALVGAFSSYEFQQAGANVVLSLIGGVLLAALAGAVFFGLVMRRLKRSSQLMRVVATLGLSVFITEGLALKLSNNSYFPDRAFSNKTVYIFGAHITVYDLALFGISVVLTVLLWAVYRFTRFGLQTAAVSENPRASEALGHSSERIGLINWTLGGALAGLAGILIAPDISLSISSIGFLLIPALAAALLGRFESFGMTLAGGLIVGIGSSLLTRYNLGTGWSDAFPFLLIIIVLLFRSSALPGRGEVAARLPTLGTGRIRWPIVITAAVVLGVIIVVLPTSGQLATGATLQAAIIGLSLVVVTGYAGQVSLAQYGLAGAAGFVAAKLSQSLGLDFWACLILGVLVALPIGVIVGLPALRARGVNLAIVTLGLGLTIQDVLLNNPNYAGPGGEISTNAPSLFGYSLNPTFFPNRYAILCLVLFVLCGAMVANLRRSRVGRDLVALRTNERAAEALGIDVTATKLYAFAIGSAIAGVGGVLISFQSAIVIFLQGSGPAFDPTTAITFLSFMIVGSIGYVGGALFAGQLAVGGLGAWILLEISNSPLTADWLAVAGGLASMLVVVFNPNGLSAQQARQFARRYRRLFSYLDRHPLLRSRVADAAPMSPLAQDVHLQVRELGVRFGGVVALDDVSLELRSGEILGMIGPNGAGKTSLIDAVTGHNRRYSGHVLLNGRTIDKADASRRARMGIGRSFQSLELFDDLSVEENLSVGADRPRRLNYLTDLVRPGRRALPLSAEYAACQLQLEDDLHRRPDELPFGRRRLLGIARAVAARPAVLLLDEPAAGLGDRECAELSQVLIRLAHEEGFAILLIEHDVSMVMNVSDRLIALDFGHTIAEGAPEEVRNLPAVITAYIGAETEEEAVAEQAIELQAAATLRGAEMGGGHHESLEGT
jgi:ABC-type branched-subunit amino acid transport system ATPase component/branched-subunit amino acid ABC-type transport system permease component